MKLKKQQLIILVVVLVLVLVSSVVLVLNTGNEPSPNGNGDGVESGNWIDLSGNIGAVATTTDAEFGFNDIFFINENEGWVTAEKTYHTTDGGETWEVQTTEFHCNAIWMLNENEGYAGGKSGFVYRTTDGGANWNFHGTIINTLTDISFSSQSSVGFASGFEATSAILSPEGVTLIEKITHDDHNGVSSTGPNEAWFIGGNVMLHYLDGGWVANDYPSAGKGGYNAIFMLNNKLGWAVGDNGIIAHTTDGQNWTLQQTNSSYILLDVLFLNPQEGWAIGSEGTVLHTTNGGTTWAAEAVGQTSGHVTGISAPNPDCVYICGAKGTLLKYVGD